MQQRENKIKKFKTNFDDESCWETYCPCCPQCNCDFNCDCSCGCNCVKKKIIIAPFTISAISFFLIIVEMLTKISDTDSYKEFKLTEKETLKSNFLISDRDWKNIINIEELENKYTLVLLVISFIIFIIYLTLLLCFLYENSCCQNYNPKCKKPYYSLLMIINFFGCLGNSMISFIFLSYREVSINDFRNLSLFGNEFSIRNDLNISLSAICAICYFACLILHLILYYYLYKEDDICSGCCSEVLAIVNGLKSCFKCLCCWCCCCCEKPRKNKTQKSRSHRTVIVNSLNNNIIQIPFSNNRLRKSYISNPIYIENSQMRNLIINNNNNIKLIVENSFKNEIYDYNYSQYKICGICKSFYRKGEKITILNCGHILHTDCSYDWFTNNKACPEDGLIMLN